jgi:AraC-like DNA-binding protein
VRLGLHNVQDFGHDHQVVELRRPSGIRAGFLAEVDDSASGLVHAGEQWAPGRYLVTRHSHPVWEFYLQMHGLSRWRADDRDFSLQPGNLFAVAPQVAHQMVDRPAANHHFYFAAIDLQSVLQRQQPLARLWTRSPPVIHRRQGHTVSGPFADLTRELTTRLGLAGQGLTLAVDRLVLEVTRLLLPSVPVPRHNVHPAVMRVKDLVDRDCARRWTLRDLASDVGLAPTYLAALFTTQVGMSPHRYLTERRVENARRLLESSDMPVTAIAIDVGFSSGQHFARVFRQMVGATPRQHRRTHSAST